MTRARVDWLQAKKDYFSSMKMSYRLIAEKYHVNRRGVCKRAKKEKWFEGRKSILQKANDKLPEKISEGISEYNARKFREGKIASDIGLEVLSDPSTKIYSKTATEMIGIGHKLQSEAQGLDNPKIAIQQNNMQNNVFMSLEDFVLELQKRVEERKKLNVGS